MRWHLSRGLNIYLLAFTLSVGLFGSVAVADTLTYQPGPYQGKDAWISSYYDYGSSYGVNNEYLRVGGWGDDYWSALWFDLNGLPANPSRVELKLFCLPKGSGDTSTPTSMNMYALDASNNAGGRWTEDNLSWYDNTGNVVSTKVSLSPPIQNSWYTINITNYYKNWKSGLWLNDGLYLVPTANNNRFNQFASSDYADPYYRPKLVVTYTAPYQPPSFPTSIKMPLPSGKNWKLTTEVGGTDYRATTVDPANPNQAYVDPYHLGVSYFALDFSPTTSSGGTQSNVPILAVADGYVVEAGYTSANGNYVVINHSYAPSSGSTLFNRNKGLNSFSLHMKDPPTLTKGTRVYQGTKLGIMGNTGISTGTHLHLGLKFDGAGLGREELAAIKMQSICLKQYQTTNGTFEGYYPSTNVPR